MVSLPEHCKLEFAILIVSQPGGCRCPPVRSLAGGGNRKRRQEGWTLRAIAEEEGVSSRQVRRDLSGVTSVTPDTPEYVTGRDGKTYPASKESREDALQRMAQAWDANARLLCRPRGGGRGDVSLQRARSRPRSRLPRGGAGGVAASDAGEGHGAGSSG